MPTEGERRELQKQISRVRRRLERNAARCLDRSLLAASWGDYVREHPGRSLLAAAGIGMAFSGLLSQIPLPGGIAERLADLAMGAGWSRLLDELHAALRRLRQDSAANPEGV